MYGVKGKFDEVVDINEAISSKNDTAETKTQEATTEKTEQKTEPLATEVTESPKSATENEVKQPEEKVVESKEEVKEPSTPEINDDAILNYLNKTNNTEFKSIDEFKNSLTKEKIVNPYDDVLDDSDRAYLEFKKNGGGNYNDFLELNKDWDAVEPKDIARDKVRQETGLKLSDEEADEYLASELGIDLDYLEGVDKIKFNSYVNKHKKTLKEQQKQYSTANKPSSNQPQQDIVELDNGQKMLKSEYDDLVNRRQVYEKSIKEAVDSITGFDFNLTVNDNGEKRDMNFTYEVSDEDRHSMLSASSDVNKYIQERFSDKQGNFNYKAFERAMFFTEENNQQKAFQALAEKVRGETIEEMLKDRNNVNFSTGTIQKSNTKKAGYGSLLEGKSQGGYGVIGNIN